MLDIDDMRLRDISPFGLVLATVALAFTTYAVWLAVPRLVADGFGAQIGGPVAAAAFALLFWVMVYVDTSPEFDGHCEGCGERIVANTGSDDHSQYIELNTVDAPRRAHIGPVSFVLSRRRQTRPYCSVECVENDDVPRALAASETSQWADDGTATDSEVSA